MLREPSTQRHLITELELTCAACRRTFEPEGPQVRRCQKCLVAGYCNDECQARGSGMHEPECPSVALEGFRRNIEIITGVAALEMRPSDVESWTKRAEESVMDEGQLPHGLTPERLSDAVTQGRVVLDQESDEATRERWFRLLFLWGLSLCSAVPGYGIKEKEVYLSIVEEVLSYWPPGSPGWANREITFICGAGGAVLRQLGRVQESVILARHLRELVKGSLHHAASESSTIAILDSLYQGYAQWTYDVVDLQLSNDPESLDEAEEAHEIAIKLAEVTSEPAATLGLLYHQAAFIQECKGDNLEALKLLRRAIQLPELPVSLYMDLAKRAITHLRRLNRDTQALVLIADVLIKARRHPNTLCDAALAHVHLDHSIILCRSGKNDRALRAVLEAMRLLDDPAPADHDPAQSKERERVRPDAAVHVAEVLERLGRMEVLEAWEARLGRVVLYRPSALVREARRWLEGGRRPMAMRVLRQYAENYERRGSLWQDRGRWKEGDAVKPLQLLRDLLKRGSHERAKVEALIERTASEDEALRQQALEELQAEMRQGRQQGREEKEGGARAGGSKASRKKRKKRDRKKQQRLESQGGGGETVGVELAGLSLEEEEEEQRGAGGGEVAEGCIEEGAGGELEEDDDDDDEDECPMCLLPFEEGEQEHGQEEVLGCGHRYHDLCMDRWMCKCQEKGLLPTCPMCRAQVVRGAGAEQW